jgi:hypothetical protein
MNKHLCSLVAGALGCGMLGAVSAGAPDDRWYVAPMVGGVDADVDRHTDDGYYGALAVGKPLV